MTHPPPSTVDRRIHVFVGTVAEYIKTAPLIRLMEEERVAYRLIDSGQHSASARRVRAELGLREPDVLLGGRDTDVDAVGEGLRWGLGLLSRLGRGSALREQVFGGAGGLCVVHGDTITTLLATLIARRAGLRVAHLEAGLRSHSIVQPFPEELTRRVVSRLAAVLFAPGQPYAANLAAARRRSRIVTLEANTGLEALRQVLGGQLQPVEQGPAIVTMHRLENLRIPQRVRDLVSGVLAVAERWPTRFVVHPPTRSVLEEHGIGDALREAGVELVGLQSHDRFAAMLRDAPLVLTDGGSIQEECALLGVPTILWRGRTERLDGLGENVVLADHDPAVVRRVIGDLESFRRAPAPADAAPSRTILDVLLDEVAR